MDIDKTNEFNERIWKLWHDNPRLAGNRIPKFVLPPESIKSGLVYLSLNPSFPKINEGFRAEIHQKLNLTYPTDFIWSNSSLKDKFDAVLACKYAQVHRLSRNHYRWDNNLKTIAENDEYGHVDLFFAADTRFACLPEPYHDKGNHCVSKNPNFIQQQLTLSYEYLKAHKPKVIIAVYKQAAEIFLKYHNLRVNHASVSLEKNRPFQKIDLNFDKLKILLIVCNDLPGMRNRTSEEKKRNDRRH